jgi:hypothetical protein
MPGGFRITLDGDERLARKLAGLGSLARELAVEATRESVDVVKNTMIEGITSPPKTGRIYTQYYRRNTQTGGIFPIGPRPPHQASAEGEYPASDTGNLVRSIYTEVDDLMAGFEDEPMDVQLGFNFDDLARAQNMITGIIGADAEYAAPLEYKPPERGGRPFATRALIESQDQVLAIFLGKMRGRFGGGG